MENAIGCKQGKKFRPQCHSLDIQHLSVFYKEVGKNFALFFTGRPKAFEFSASPEASASHLYMRLFYGSLKL